MRADDQTATVRRNAARTSEGLSQSIASEKRVQLRAALTAALLAILVGAGIYEALPGRRAGTPAPTRAHALAREGLLSLPLAAQGPVSASLGSADSAYQIGEPRSAALVAANPAQRLRSTFTASRVTVSAGATHVGLRLLGAGFGASLRDVGSATPRAHANRVIYALPGIEESYANGPLGLEQAFTLERAPVVRAQGPLTVAIGLSGNARATLAAGAQSVMLKAAAGRRLRYDGLSVTDANGRTLHSWLALEGGRLLVRVDAAGARYPLRIDPLVQDGSKLTGSGETGSGELGWSVAISASGTTAIAGAPFGNSTGGAAFVFTRSGTKWTQQGEKLVPSEPSGNEFGYSVALSAEGNTALVGARSGEAAYVFTRSGEKWTQQAKLQGEGEEGAVEFGRAVALSADGNTALVSGPSNAFKGAVWVFTRAGEKWAQQGSKLTGGGETGEGIFGWSVALSAEGNTALIGAPENGGAVGAAWVFTRSGSTWSEQAKLTGAGEGGDGEFGESVALSENGSTAMVGASVDDTNGGGDDGAVFAFVRTGTSWSQQAKIIPAEESGAGEFGYGLSLSGSGNTALIGAPYDGTAGAAWVFTRSGETWSQQGSKITGSGENSEGFFGRIVSLSGNADNAVIGASSDSSQSGDIFVFGASPTATTDPGSEVTPSSETLNATVNPNGQEVSACKFEYGTTTAYGKSANCATKPGAGESPVAVSAPIKELASNTSYHFRIVATNALGTSDGADETFTTLATSNTGETKEEAKPAKAKDGELSAEASSGTGAVTVGPYGSDIGGAALRSSDGKYIDVYRSTSATFAKVEFKDCELGGAKTIWWYRPATGWLPISEPTAVYTEAPTPCITVTITQTSTPNVTEMTGMRYGFGEPPGEQEYGKCLPAKGFYKEGNCQTPFEKGGKIVKKGKFEWYPAPAACHAKKDGRYAEAKCLKEDIKKGKPSGKFEKGSEAFSASGGEAKLELKGEGTIKCSASSAEGALTGLKVATETITLSGCEREGSKCTSTTQAPGTVRTDPLETLTYEQNGKYFNGLAGNPVAVFTCGSTNFTLRGEVSGETSGDLNVDSSKAETAFKAGSGYQGLKDESSSQTSEATLTMTLATTAVEPFEIAEKAKG